MHGEARHASRMTRRWPVQSSRKDAADIVSRRHHSGVSNLFVVRRQLVASCSWLWLLLAVTVGMAIAIGAVSVAVAISVIAFIAIAIAAAVRAADGRDRAADARGRCAARTR